MKIAIDTTAIPAHRTGAGNYIFNLVRTLTEVDRANQYYIFTQAMHAADFATAQSNVHVIVLNHTNRPARMLWEQVTLPRYLKRLKIDVLHSPHYTMPLAKPTTSIVTFCDMTFFLIPDMHSRSKRLFFRTMMRLSARRADHLIAISESTKQDMIRVLGLPASRIKVTPLAAGPSYRPLPRSTVERVCEAYDLEFGQYIAYVGVLEPRKNVPLLINAYAAIATDFPDVPLVIAGKKGWMYDAIFNTVQQLGIQDRVRFLGYVPDDDLPALYNGARAFVYPSNYEGFGLPVLEAMQSGAVVITTNVSSMPEVAGDGAMLIEPNDQAGLEVALRRVLCDPQFSAELIERAARRATQFSWDRCARETLAVYQAVAQRKYRKERT